jgi:hypothetical protein
MERYLSFMNLFVAQLNEFKFMKNSSLMQLLVLAIYHLIKLIFYDLFCHFRYELRIRYIPSSINDILVKDRVTFHYFYDQVRH